MTTNPANAHARAATPRAAGDDEAFIPSVDRRGVTQTYRKRNPVPKFAVAGPFIAYASPDSTFAITRRLIERAQSSILIGMYDFTAGYMKELLLSAMARGIKVELMLDIDSAEERRIFDELVRFGATCVEAPSCANGSRKLFASSHEKVIVIDEHWTLIQSGDYSAAGIPNNEADGEAIGSCLAGNRDVGIAIDDRALAQFFSAVLRSDMVAELDTEVGAGIGPTLPILPPGLILQPAPTQRPAQLFSSRQFAFPRMIKVTPVLSPDNYLAVVPEFLGAATRSVLIEQQYIRTSEPEVKHLLGILRGLRANKPDLTIKIVLGHPFADSDPDRSIGEIRALADYGFKLGTTVRILNPDRFVHCHSNMIVIDDLSVMLGSQSWSHYAMTKNREAGVILAAPELAAYFAEIVRSDWETGTTDLSKPLNRQPLAHTALGAGAPTVWVSRGDYAVDPDYRSSHI